RELGTPALTAHVLAFAPAPGKPSREDASSTPATPTVSVAASTSGLVPRTRVVSTWIVRANTTQTGDCPACAQPSRSLALHTGEVSVWSSAGRITSPSRGPRGHTANAPLPRHSSF